MMCTICTTIIAILDKRNVVYSAADLTADLWAIANGKWYGMPHRPLRTISVKDSTIQCFRCFRCCLMCVCMHCVEHPFKTWCRNTSTLSYNGKVHKAILKCRNATECGFRTNNHYTFQVVRGLEIFK